MLSLAGGATPKRSDASLYADCGVKFLRILNINDGEILERELKYITSEVHQDDLARSQLSAGDVLLTITGRVGSAAVVGNEHLPANINQHIARLRIDAALCQPEFLSEWLNSPAGLELSNRYVSGGTRAALDYGAIRGIRIPLPDLPEQERLVAAMYAARAERKAKLAEAEELLAGMDDFLMDTLGIKPPADETRRVFAIANKDSEERLDSWFNHPRYKTLESVLGESTFETTELGGLLSSISSGATPSRNDASLYAKSGYQIPAHSQCRGWRNYLSRHEVHI